MKTKKKKVWTPKMRKEFARKMLDARIAADESRGHPWISSNRKTRKSMMRAMTESRKRARTKNPPLIQPFKVVIGATAKRGHKTMMWFDGKHFRTAKVKRAMFSSIHNAKVMALSLIKRFPVLSKYMVGIYKA